MSACLWRTKRSTIARDGLLTIGMLFFLFVAGLEVDFSRVRHSGPKVVATSLLGILVPFALGFGLVWFVPALWGPPAETHHLALAMVIGVALAITALPVIARILVDLGLMQDELATVVLSAAIIDDLIGWTLLALVLSAFAPHGASYASGMPWLTPCWVGCLSLRWSWLAAGWDRARFAGSGCACRGQGASSRSRRSRSFCQLRWRRALASMRR